jgi:hypothetical protein
MQAIELVAEIDHNQQIHFQLPKNINVQKVKVIVIYEEMTQPIKPITLGLFKDKIQLSDDFNEPLPLLIANKPLTPYELGKNGFGSDQTHEGDIAQHTKDLLKARFTNNADH